MTNSGIFSQFLQLNYADISRIARFTVVLFSKCIMGTSVEVAMKRDHSKSWFTTDPMKCAEFQSNHWIFDILINICTISDLVTMNLSLLQNCRVVKFFFFFFRFSVIRNWSKICILNISLFRPYFYSSVWHIVYTFYYIIKK